MASRPLNAAERALAMSVYGASLNYDEVQISDRAVGGQVITAARPGGFSILWANGFVDVMSDEDRKATLVHEMAHVWQGNNGRVAAGYMAASIGAQVGSGVESIIRERDWGGVVKRWDRHRSTAYLLDAARFGEPWTSFNVEQQATIVETWYTTEAVRRRRNDGPGVFGGAMSPYDARFPYIRDNIRKRMATAPYRPVDLPSGGDRDVKAMQDKLVALGFLDPRQADGLVGRTRSATLDAVQAFQRANGLKPDRLLGGANSETRRALARPIDQLRRAP